MPSVDACAARELPCLHESVLTVTRDARTAAMMHLVWRAAAGDRGAPAPGLRRGSRSA